ncbi:hypothetical protein Ferp_0507 [Ferroglobus placidus DSM 10642]|uniref:Uncharacterized protein n=2 Tax=Ferroglobus placidus TaxID=54261 RepID=D3S348_FERPA|nr:hypothetical protein Ferp_0507 [Ferroglobus placidus DSM 10642]
MSAAAKKAVKVGVGKDVWYAIKAISGKRDIARNVEKALQMYLDIMRDEAVIVRKGGKYSVVNVFDLEYEKFEELVDCDIYPLGSEFSEKILTHLISLVLPRAKEGSYRIEDRSRGYVANVPVPMPQHDMYPELLARKLLRGEVLEVTLSFWKGDPPDFREDFAVFKRDEAFVVFMSKKFPEMTRARTGGKL